jgi:hypothetical protein
VSAMLFGRVLLTRADNKPKHSAVSIFDHLGADVWHAKRVGMYGDLQGAKPTHHYFRCL